MCIIGGLLPDKPEACPGDEEDKPQLCKIHRDGRRVRKCGPGFMLCVFQCIVHERRFTVYPPGWTPYSRKPIAALDHLGRMVSNVNGDATWDGTEFDALLAASRSEIWPEELSLGPDDVKDPQSQSKKTQHRHIAGAMQLLCLDTKSTDKDREAVARTLRLPYIFISEIFERIRAGPTMTTRGKLGVEILSRLPAQQHTVFSLFTTGQNRGFWGAPCPSG